MHPKIVVAKGILTNLFVYDENATPNQLTPALLSLLTQIARQCLSKPDEVDHFLIPSDATVQLDQQSYLLVGETIFGVPVRACEDLSSELFNQSGLYRHKNRGSVIAAVTVKGKVILGGY